MGSHARNQVQMHAASTMESSSAILRLPQQDQEYVISTWLDLDKTVATLTTRGGDNTAGLTLNQPVHHTNSGQITPPCPTLSHHHKIPKNIRQKSFNQADQSTLSSLCKSLITVAVWANQWESVQKFGARLCTKRSIHLGPL